MKKAVTLLLTQEQYNKIKKKREATGNSQNSIIREALNKYLDRG